MQKTITKEDIERILSKKINLTKEELEEIHQRGLKFRKEIENRIEKMTRRKGTMK